MVGIPRRQTAGGRRKHTGRDRTVARGSDGGRAPAEDVETTREVEHWRHIGQRKAVRVGDGVDRDLGLGQLQWPRCVVDVSSARDAAPVDRVETVALREPVVEVARLRAVDRSGWPVTAPEYAGKETAMRSLAA